MSAARTKADGAPEWEQRVLQLQQQLNSSRAKLKSFDAERGYLREQVDKYKVERLALQDTEWRMHKRGEEASMILPHLAVLERRAVIPS